MKFYVKKFFFITQYFTRLTRQFHWKYTNDSDDGAVDRYKKYLKFTKVDEHGSNIDPMIRYVQYVCLYINCQAE